MSVDLCLRCTGLGYSGQGALLLAPLNHTQKSLMSQITNEAVSTTAIRGLWQVSSVLLVVDVIKSEAVDWRASRSVWFALSLGTARY